MDEVIKAMHILQKNCSSPNCTNCLFYRPPRFFADNTCKINNPHTWEAEIPEQKNNRKVKK